MLFKNNKRKTEKINSKAGKINLKTRKIKTRKIKTRKIKTGKINLKTGKINLKDPNMRYNNCFPEINERLKKILCSTKDGCLPPNTHIDNKKGILLFNPSFIPLFQKNSKNNIDNKFLSNNLIKNDMIFLCSTRVIAVYNDNTTWKHKRQENAFLKSKDERWQDMIDGTVLYMIIVPNKSKMNEYKLRLVYVDRNAKGTGIGILFNKVDARLFKHNENIYLTYVKVLENQEWKRKTEKGLVNACTDLTSYHNGSNKRQRCSKIYLSKLSLFLDKKFNTINLIYNIPVCENRFNEYNNEKNWILWNNPSSDSICMSQWINLNNNHIYFKPDLHSIMYNCKQYTVKNKVKFLDTPGLHFSLGTCGIQIPSQLLLTKSENNKLNHNEKYINLFCGHAKIKEENSLDSFIFPNKKYNLHPKKSRNLKYFMYFYIINNKNSAIKLSKFFIFESSNMWKIFFPTGLYYFKEMKEFAVSYGIGDMEINFAKIKLKLLQKLFTRKNTDEEKIYNILEL